MKLPRKLKKAAKNMCRTKYVLEMITGQLSHQGRLCGLTTTRQAVLEKAQADLLHPYPRTKHIRRLLSKIIYNYQFGKDLRNSSFNKYFIIKGL